MGSTTPPLLMADCGTLGTLMNSSVSQLPRLQSGGSYRISPSYGCCESYGRYLGKTFGDSLCHSVHSSTCAQLSKHSLSHYPVIPLERGEDRDSGAMPPILLTGN